MIGAVILHVTRAPTGQNSQSYPPKTVGWQLNFRTQFSSNVATLTKYFMKSTTVQYLDDSVLYQGTILTNIYREY